MPGMPQPVKDVLTQEAASWFDARDFDHLEKLVAHKVPLSELGIPENRQPEIELVRVVAHAMAVQSVILRVARRIAEQARAPHD